MVDAVLQSNRGTSHTFSTQRRATLRQSRLSASSPPVGIAPVPSRLLKRVKHSRVIASSFPSPSPFPGDELLGVEELTVAYGELVALNRFLFA